MSETPLRVPAETPRDLPAWRRWVPHPGWSVALVLIWLSLNGSASAGHWLLALVLGFALPYATRRFWPARPAARRPLRAFARWVAFVLLVIGDVIVANFQVARAVLSPVRRLSPGFAEVPIDLDDERAVVVLAHTITLTPGTLSVDVAPDRRSITIHALDMPDPAATVREIKDRYERRIAEIYSC
ncbi:MAG: Na+/H+ antiporter subunit E [Steroidobacteraceae bacterium]|jgi:multicomponent K+:H+ antiporter subunit E|nr:Na+/H+ antiporter subunit E [Steroidobacteraceae bacterium]